MFTDELDGPITQQINLYLKQNIVGKIFNQIANNQLASKNMLYGYDTEAVRKGGRPSAGGNPFRLVE